MNDTEKNEETTQPLPERPTSKNTSPSEKLKDPNAPKTPPPGVENPESDEIRKEVNPNTE